MKRIFPSKSLVLSVAFIAATLACTPAFAAKKSKVAEDEGMSLLEMSDQLDGIEKQDFQAAIERATSCTQARDFPCAESELTKAAKSANTGKDKKMLLASRQSLANEKQQLANEIRRVEEERQARIRREEQAEQAEQERQARVRRAEEEAEDRQSTRDYNAAIGAQILQGINENAAILGNIDRQTTAAYAETNRRLAVQAAERKHAREEQEEREAERRRDARHAESERAAKREASKNAALANDARRTADMRQQDETDANARKKREADELKSRQEQEAKRRDEERRSQELRDSIERKRVAEAEAARKQAEAAAAKQAEQQARAQYLRSVASGTRLVATKCPDGAGKFYATGTRPNIKPELVACVDVHYRAYCPGSRQHSNGVARNFIGMSGCFGDTYDINPKPDCNVDQVRIDIVEARVCGG
ncbi:MAG: hypothetical protein Q7T29_17270 [Gallionella sp.]|nr:hypothetical protein [Gallionella sp.]